MIYTVTFNPSLDYIVTVDNFELGMTNRTSSELMFPGGKGINVSIVLNNLGLKNAALGFAAGFVGDEIIRKTSEFGVDASFIKLEEGNSRINVKLRSIDGTEINGQGPVIPADKLKELTDFLGNLKEGDVLVLAGSIPGSMPNDIYENICADLDGKGVMVVVDATSKLLLNVLKYHPFMIKPNNHELGEIFGVKVETKEDIITYAKKLQEMGAVNVLISLGGKGAMLVAADGSIYSAKAPKGELKNSVGAGDSMVAGFIAGYLSDGNYETAFRTGVATGSASAFSDNLATKAEVDDLLTRVEAERLA